MTREELLQNFVAWTAKHINCRECAVINSALPGANPLKAAHAALDAAVLTAYGFDAKQDLLAQLLALNLQVAGKIEAGQPVTAPGIPAGYPKPKELVTADCIRPS